MGRPLRLDAYRSHGGAVAPLPGNQHCVRRGSDRRLSARIGSRHHGPSTRQVRSSSITIPADQFADGLARIAVTFASWPLLAGATGSRPTLAQLKVVDG